MNLAEHIANKLATGLPHPGDQDNPPRTLLLTWFRPQAGMPPEVLKQMEKLGGVSAKAVAEAIVHLIETDYDIVPKQRAEEPS